MKTNQTDASLTAGARSHLMALQSRLSLERNRLAFAKGAAEIALRTVWVAQAEKEVAGEMAFLGMTELPAMSDDELLAELGGAP